MFSQTLRSFGLLIAWLIAYPSYGASAAAVDSLGYVFKAGRFTKVARLATLHADDLRHASRVENLDGLLALAQAENRLASIDAVDAIQLSKRYNRIDNGDVLLLTCLRSVSCEPDKFLGIVQTSRLHAEVVLRNPALKSSQVDHEVGAITERLMDRYFQNSGWTRVEGQIGRQGIDGLYIKREGGVVKDVLISESKYNSSPLGTTNHGMQMNEEWTRRKLVELKAAYPNQPIYDDIGRCVDKGAYRAVVWNLKVEDQALYVKVSKIKSKGGDVEIADTAGTDVAELWTHPTNRVPLNGSGKGFEAQVAGWYRAELDAIGQAAF